MDNPQLQHLLALAHQLHELNTEAMRLLDKVSQERDRAIAVAEGAIRELTAIQASARVPTPPWQALTNRD